jgi:hypothetical protein
VVPGFVSGVGVEDSGGVRLATNFYVGESWSLLPQALEDMKDSDRRSLAEAQADAYLKSLLSEETYLRLLTSTLSD